jgi:hypothetical protein
MQLENENLIRKFLFDEMSEEERFDFEERFITDADLFEEIKVIEDELIEKYVRGWMDSAERSKFKQHFLTTKKRRERVEFSRRMINTVQEKKELTAPVIINETESSEESIWHKLAALFIAPRFVMAGGLALIVAVLGSWILYQNFGGNKTELVKKETPTPTTISMPTDSPDKLPQNNQDDEINTNQNTQTNLEDNSLQQTDNSNKDINSIPKKTSTPKNSKRNIKKTPVPKKTPPTQKTAPNPILAVFAGTVRSGGKNNVLNLPKNARAAILQLNLESIDYKIYQAQLTDQDGNVIFQRGNLKARKSKINFNIPAKHLKKGDYIIKLYGKNDAGENESVADFQFRVNQ